MDWQLTGVFTTIAGAVAYLSWVSWRAWKRAKTGCGGGCGCGSSGSTQGAHDTLIPSDGLHLRRTTTAPE